MATIYTIGYGGRPTDEFIALLKRYSIDVLVDVRTQPYSKFTPDFTRSSLAKIVARAGIDYVFMGDSLGGRPDDADCFVGGKLDATRCEERDWYQRGIRDLKALAREQRVAIMCSEKDPANFHRSYVIGATVAKDSSFAVAHINKAGELKTQAALAAEIKPRQLDMLSN